MKQPDYGEMYKKGALKRGGQAALAGAQIGSLFAPGVGTAIGAGVGFLAGSIYGGVQAKNTFEDQMKLFKVGKEKQEMVDKMAEASQKEMLRKQKKEASSRPPVFTGLSDMAPDEMDVFSSGFALRPAGSYTNYDAYKAGM